MITAFAHSKPVRIGLILLVLALLSLTGSSRKVLASPPPPEPSVINSSGPFPCPIKLIWVTATVVQVECTTALPGTVVYFFGAPIDAASYQSTNRILALITTAYALGEPINVYYTTDTASNPPGCLTGTCRRLDGVNITP